MPIQSSQSRKGSHLFRSTVLLLCVGAITAACTRTAPVVQRPVVPVNRTPTALEPAPLTPVEGSQLPPPGTSETVNQGVPAEPKPETQVAKVDPSKAQPVTRQALVGAWTVSTGGANCQLFLALTKWSGGYRAAPRGCAGTSIGDVAAWDVKGKQVVLVGSSGSGLATLYRSSSERFDGSTSSGGSISFSR